MIGMNIMRHHRSSRRSHSRHGSLGRAHVGHRHFGSNHHHHRHGLGMRTSHHTSSRGYSGTRGSVSGGTICLAMSIPFLIIGIIFFVVGYLARAWSFAFAISFMASGGMFFLPGIILLIVWIRAPKDHDKWWNSLPPGQQNFYLSLGGDVKQLYRMHQEGKLPGVQGVENSTEETPVDGLQIHGDNFTVSPDLIRNLGEYIAGSRIDIDDITGRQTNVAGEIMRDSSILDNESKEEILAEYKEIVKKVWSDGQLTEGEKAVLDHLRSRDEITMDDHRKIENEVLSDMVGG